MSTPILTSYRLAFADALAGALGLPREEIEPQLKTAEPQHGDLTFPTFNLAKSQRKAPPQIAAALAQGLHVDGVQISAAGPYVNARFLAEPFTELALAQARTLGASYGCSTQGEGKTVVIDYSSPNIAKPIGFHHIRTTFLGHAIANLYRSQGYSVEGINYLGDWGKQFGLVAVGFETYGDPARRTDMGHLVEVYVKANARAEAEPAFDELARAFFRRMEEGDEEALKIWRELRETSLTAFKAVYRRLGIAFEHYEGESWYQGRMDAVVAAIAEKVGVKESLGALVVDMPYAENEPPVLLKKSDGSTLYATRDLAAAIDRHDRFRFDKSLYVVAADQSLHFRQFFGVLRQMKLPWADRLEHVSFGRVHGMSTRKGQVVLLTDVLDEAKSRALEKVQANIDAGKMQTADAELLAEQIGLGAIVFGDLKNRRASDYTFDWEEVLEFDGHTGPYLQYAHARACSILEKGGPAPSAPTPGLLSLPEEQALVREIARLPLAIREALAQNEPSIVARLLLDVAAAFSRWYTLGNQDRTKRVLVDEPELAPVRAARLALTDAVRICLERGLSILGIPAPKNM